MIKTRKQTVRRQADRQVGQPKSVAPRLAQPIALDDKQLKQVAGGNTEALPKGTW